MPDEATKSEETQTTQPAEKSEKTFTQAQLDSIIKSRVAEVKSQYSDYDELKTRAQEIDTIKGERTSLAKEVESLTKDRDNAQTESLKLRVAVEKNLPLDAVDRLRGANRDELEADADSLLKFVKPAKAGDFGAGVREEAPREEPGLGEFLRDAMNKTRK